MPEGANERLIDDAGFASRVAQAEIAVDGLEMTVFRILSAQVSGGSVGDASSTVKILATETHQAITQLLLEAAGQFVGHRAPSAGTGPRDVASYFGGRAQSIYGGTNEIQKNIIARKVLGL